MSSEPKRLCIISSRADSQQVDELVKRLLPFTDRNVLALWHWNTVPAGADVQAHLADFLPQADGVLVWISPDLWAEEAYSLFKQNMAGLKPQAVVLPVLARHAVWESDDFLKSFTAELLPANRRPMPTDSAERRDAWLTEVANGVAAKLGFGILKREIINPFWKKWSFWGWLIPILVGVYFAYPSFVADSHENENYALNKKTVASSPRPGCGFPAEFDSTHLYILITRFEDYDNSDETECYGRGIESYIDSVKNREHLPIKFHYIDSLSPNQSDEAARWCDYYHADLIIWGKLRNAGPNCQADGFCMKFQPSDTLVRYAGGHLVAKVDNEFKPNVKASDLESGLIRMGKESFDAWLIGMFNLKIGRRKPEFYRILEEWPVERQVEEYRRRGRLFYSLQNFSRALADFDRAIGLKASESLFFYRGNAKYHLGQKEAAITDYNRAIQLNPHDGDYYRGRGLAKYGLGQKEAAIADYDHAIQLNPQDGDYYCSRGNAKCGLGQKEAAIADYDHAIQLNPQDGDYYYNRSLAKYGLGQNEAAIADYDHAIQLNPHDGDYYCGRGLAKYGLGQNEAAIADYNRAIQLNPHDGGFYSNRGNVKANLGQNEDAIADYDRAIQLNPHDGSYYYNRGLAKYGLGQKQAAIADYNRAIQLNPHDGSCYYNRGLTKYGLGQNEAAIADYDHAIQLNPHDGDYYCGRGLAKYELGQKQAAIADYDQAILIDPNYAAAYNNRGIAKYDLDQKEAAITDYDQAISINPSLATTYNNRSNIHWKNGNYLFAVRDKLQVMRLNGGWWFYFSIVLIILGFFSGKIWRSKPIRGVLQKLSITIKR